MGKLSPLFIIIFTFYFFSFSPFYPAYKHYRYFYILEREFKKEKKFLEALGQKIY
jgi:hypothetical protein